MSGSHTNEEIKRRDVTIHFYLWGAPLLVRTQRHSFVLNRGTV